MANVCDDQTRLVCLTNLLICKLCAEFARELAPEEAELKCGRFNVSSGRLRVMKISVAKLAALEEAGMTQEQILNFAISKENQILMLVVLSKS